METAAPSVSVLDAVQADQLRSMFLELEEYDAALARRRRESGITYFIPNAPQLAATRSKARVVLSIAGNRSGKSEGGAAELVCHLQRQYPSCACHGEWFSKERRFHRSIKAVVCATEFPIIERTIEPKILKLLPAAYIQKLQRTPQGYLRRILCVDGSTVDILTNEMDQLAFESADWDFAWVDEPMNRSKWTAIWRGLTDRRGMARMTLTPLTEPWLKEDLYDKADGKLIDVVTATSYDNTQDIHGNTILPREHIEQLEAGTPEEERASRISGQFLHLRGVVYKRFSQAVHVRELKYQHPDPVWCVLDPHTRKPHHVIWAYMTRNDQLCVDRELVMEGTLKELAKMILYTELRAGYRMRRRVIDPNYGRTPMIVTGRTVIEELAQPPFAIRFSEVCDDIDTGIMKIKELLHYDITKPLSATNTPGLFFDGTRCPKTIHSLANYQFIETWGKRRGESDPKEDPKQKDTDGADCVRYLCMSDPRWESLSQAMASAPLPEMPY